MVSLHLHPTTTSNFPSAMAPKTMKAKAAMKAMKTAKVMSKGGLATELAEGSGLKKGEITKVLDSLAEIGTREVKKAGKFTLPGLCMIKTRKKKATLRLLFLFLEMQTLGKGGGSGRFSKLVYLVASVRVLACKGTQHLQ